jgi:hypothetical protein
MNCLRSQFELRFTPIMGFDGSIAKITAPLQKIGAELLYNEINNGKYVLVFSDDSYLIDIRNDRMVFVSSKDLVNFTNPSGPFFHFLNAFERLKLMDGYIGLTHSLLAEWHVIEHNSNFDTNKDAFISSFFTPKITDTFKQPGDINIAVESHIKGFNTKFTFGPFNKETDIEKHNLKFILNNDSSNFNLNGLLCQSVITNSNTESEIELVRNMIEVSKNVRKSIKI